MDAGRRTPRPTHSLTASAPELRPGHHLSHLLPALAVLALVILLSPVAQVFAATITVNATCTLAQAINEANGATQGVGSCAAGTDGTGAAGHDTIALSRDITLTASPPEISTHVTINGNGRTIDGDNSYRPFTIYDATHPLSVTLNNVTLNNVTLTKGRSPSRGGGAIQFESANGSLTLNNVIVSNSTAGTSVGGGISCGGAGAAMTINDSVFSGNTGTGGGGIGSTCSSMTITRSAFRGNTSGSWGGAIWISTTAETINLVLTNSTFFNNRAGAGAAVNLSGAAASVYKLTHVTMTGNTATINEGAAVVSARGSLQLRNSILYGNSSGDCRMQGGQITVNQNNIIETPGNGIETLSDNVGTTCGPGTNGSSADPQLAASATGDVPYFSIPRDSPAVDAAGDCTSLTPSITEDQRGTTRPYGSACDIGAYEYEPLVWSGTLSVASLVGYREKGVGDQGTYVGCSPGSCIAQLLPSHTFTYGGTEYEITTVLLSGPWGGRHTGGYDLMLETSPGIPRNLALRVRVGGSDVQFAVKDGTGSVVWQTTGLRWSEGNTVGLSLVELSDDTPRVSLSASSSLVKEGDAVTLTATLSAALANAVTIPLTLGPFYHPNTDTGTRQPVGFDAADVTAPTSITIPAGQTSATATLQTRQDTEPLDIHNNQKDEQLWLRLHSGLPPSVVSGASKQVDVRIIDDDPLPKVTLSVGLDGVWSDVVNRRPYVDESNGAVKVRVHIDRDHVGKDNKVTFPNRLHYTPADIRLSFTSTGANQAGSADYSALLQVPVQGREGEATFAINDDTDAEGWEQFTVALIVPSYLAAGDPTSQQVWIKDNEQTQPQVGGAGVNPPPQRMGNGDDSQPQADLITRMNNWRNDPQWVSYKSHTDRWDRALLALGESVSDTSLTPMTAAEAQGLVDQGLTRWVDVAAALAAKEAREGGGVNPGLGDGQPLPPDDTLRLVPPAHHADLITRMNGWRNDPQWVSHKSHTDRWDRALLALGEPVSDSSLTPMTDAEAQGFADTPWGERWVPVAAALKTVVTGTSAADTLTGTSGNDLLVGLGGADTLSGQGGYDELRGGSGNDSLSGGADADRFVFFSGDTGAKTLTDFAAGDFIVLKGSGWASAADIIASVQAVGSTGYRYTLASGLTVATTNNRTLRTEDFTTE